MIRAAAVLCLSDKGNVLWIKRGPDGDFAGYWALPAGGIEGDEEPDAAASRELREETGLDVPPAKLTQLTKSVMGPGSFPGQPDKSVECTTFVARVTEGEPVLNEESAGYVWRPVGLVPEPMHPGCRIALDRLGMDELGVARAIADGRLTSPQRYENVLLYAMRISGTGVSYRDKDNEFVYRPPEHYTSPDAVARAAGLPILWEHTSTDMLNSDEFAERVVGTMFVPYVRGDELWGVAKIYDAGAIEALESGQLSTSPGVIFRGRGVNQKYTFGDGNVILREGKPTLLDHLAICTAGVWDKGGDPSGIVQADVRKDSKMADEDDKKAPPPAEEKKDGTATQVTPDKVLASLDALCSRMDAVCSKMDAWEDEKKRDSKRDADEEDDKEKEKKDSKKDTDGESFEEEVEKRPAQDRKKDSKRDAKKDADEDDEKESKKDAIINELLARDKRREAEQAELTKQLAVLSSKLPRQVSDKEYHEMVSYQAKADSVYRAFSEQAPKAMVGEDLSAYRRRLLAPMMKHSAAWGKKNLDEMPDNSLDVLEDQVYKDAMTASYNPVGLEDGVIVPIRISDNVTEFRGNKSFIHALKRPARRVVAFNTARD